MELDFTNYHFDVMKGVDTFSWQEWSGLSDEALFEAIAFKHHSKLVNFILECQTYPTPQSMVLALTLANNFNPEKRGAWPSQSTLGELLGVSRDVIRTYTKDLESTGYWVLEKDPVTNFITYRLSRSTMMVFGQWLIHDRAGKREYGKGSPNIVSKANKARPNNRVTSPTAEGSKTHEEKKQELFAIAGTTTAEINTIRAIVNEMAAKESLSDSEGVTLTKRLVDRIGSGGAGSRDELLLYSNELMTLRRKNMAAKTPAQETPVSMPFVSSSLA